MLKHVKTWLKHVKTCLKHLELSNIFLKAPFLGYARIGPHRNFGLPHHPAMYPANQTGHEVAVAGVGEVANGGSLYMLKLR